MTTPRLKEKAGQYFEEGDLICTVEEPADSQAEIALSEQDVSRVQPGQAVQLKARALPFRIFQANVDRIAPAAEPADEQSGEVQSTFTVYCRLNNATAELRPGMTGYARINTGRRPMGEILLNRAMRYFRTEFWW